MAYQETKVRISLPLYARIVALKEAKKIPSVNKFAEEAFAIHVPKVEKRKRLKDGK